MTNQQILEKAIQQAVDGGWKEIYGQRVLRYRNSSDKYIKLQTDDDGAVGGAHFEISTIIFNHDFAKALWGEETAMIDDPLSGNKLGYGPVWKEKLMHMVIADDPIAYLGANI